MIENALHSNVHGPGDSKFKNFRAASLTSSLPPGPPLRYDHLNCNRTNPWAAKFSAGLHFCAQEWDQHMLQVCQFRSSQWLMSGPGVDATHVAGPAY
jgi:hypothetical protein